MKKYMMEYKKELDSSLEKDDIDIDFWLEYHEKHILFFQHERLVHFLVTFLFAILTVLSFGADIFAFSPAVFLLSLIFLTMTIFYIRHYYFLENYVQEMYIYYDRLYKKSKKGDSE